MGERRDSYMRIGVLFGLGFSLFVMTMAGLWIGVWLDRKTGRGIFTSIGLILGLFAGIHRSWMTIRPFMSRRKR